MQLPTDDGPLPPDWEPKKPVASPTARPEGWVDPPEPAGPPCACGAPVRAIYSAPVFWDGKPCLGTGVWEVHRACEDCIGREQEATAAQDVVGAARAHLKRVSGFLERAGIPPAYSHMTLETWRSPSPGASEAVSRAIAGQSVMFWGLPGVGKTHAATGILRQRIQDTAKPGLWVYAPDLMVEFRQHAKYAEKGAKLMDDLASVGTLVLDDLGAARATIYAVECLSSLLDRRLRAGRGGLSVTSDKSPNELAASLHERIASRLIGMCAVVKLEGPDGRMGGMLPLQS